MCRWSWIQLSVGLAHQGALGWPPAPLWLIGMAVCGDNDRQELPTLCAESLHVCAPYFVCEFFINSAGLISRLLLMLTRLLGNNLSPTRKYQIIC